MTVSTECFICGGEAIGLFKTHKSHKSIPMCANCSNKNFEMTRKRNKPKEVLAKNIW